MLVSPDESGYTGAGLVKSWGGKGCLYIMPIQHVLDTSPLPFSAMEFSAMPKAKCVTCHQDVPLQLLSLHAETCCNDIEEVQLIASFSLLSITEDILMYRVMYLNYSLSFQVHPVWDDDDDCDGDENQVSHIMVLNLPNIAVIIGIIYCFCVLFFTD